MYTQYQVAGEISAAVEDVWRKTSAPLLTSKLGLSFLSKEARDFLSQSKIPLKRFIVTYLENEVRIVDMPRQGGGLVPKSGTASLTDKELAARFENPQNSSGNTQPRPKFFPEVWSAFRDEMPNGKVALLSSVDEDKPEVRYVDKGLQPASDEYSVESHDTAITSDPNTMPNAAEVRKAINYWASKNSIPLNKLMFIPAEPSQLIAERKSQRQEHRSVSSFLEVLDSLSQEQLMRVSFPGDVVVSILKNLVR